MTFEAVLNSKAIKRINYQALGTFKSNKSSKIDRSMPYGFRTLETKSIAGKTCEFVKINTLYRTQQQFIVFSKIAIHGQQADEGVLLK